ncbi:unnamed protein product [Moneuplotes crassus]|uniref:Uncharacterized protein n=1 Tax=Euplotes crassus TaxID=5936 RepID=A0AAD2D7P8_EUPCR|nr:unnamed protein product [Moneuplotes crassus]
MSQVGSHLVKGHILLIDIKKKLILILFGSKRGLDHVSKIFIFVLPAGLLLGLILGNMVSGWC